MNKNAEFYQGIAVILGWLARRGEDSLVEYAMNDNGLCLKDFKSAHVDVFDLGPITSSLFNEYDKDCEPILRGTGFSDPPSLK